MNLSAEEYAFLEKELQRAKARRVLLQAPEGMKTSVQEIADKIRSPGTECIIWAEPCFGACDIPEYHAKALGCNLIIHVGHASFMKQGKIPVLFIENRTNTDFERAVRAGIPKIPQKVGLLATIQHLGEIPKIKQILEGGGKEVFIGKSPRLKYEGQVLGCDASAAQGNEGKVDCFLVLTSGKFHAIGVAKKVSKPVLLANADTGKIESLEEEKKLIEKKRILKLEKLREAKNVGILVSTKGGQVFLNTGALQKKLESEGKRVWVIAMDYISPEKILGMKLDALVNTACPRIEDDLVFPVPVVDKNEIV